MSTIITVAAIVAVFLLLAFAAAGLFGSREQQQVDDALGKPAPIRGLKGDKSSE